MMNARIRLPMQNKITSILEKENVSISLHNQSDYKIPITTAYFAKRTRLLNVDGLLSD